MGELMTFITPVACGLLNYFLILKKFVSKSNLAFTDAVQQTLSISTAAKFLPFAVDNSKILKLLKIRRIPYSSPTKISLSSQQEIFAYYVVFQPKQLSRQESVEIINYFLDFFKVIKYHCFSISTVLIIKLLREPVHS